MSNSANDSLNVVLGQLEDELNQVRSARDQVESVLDANKALKELVRQCGDQSKSSAETLVAEASRLSGLTEAIERAASEGVEAIKRQTSDVQNAIATSSAEAARQMAAEAERVAGLSEKMERTSAETLEAVHVQASQAQETLQVLAESAAESASNSINESTQRAIVNLSEGINKAKQGIDTALESLGESSCGVEQSRVALVEAHDSAVDEIKLQSEETRRLLEAAQRQLEEIDVRITTLTSFDMEGLCNDVEKLKETEQSNAVQLMQRIRNLMIMVAICIAVGLAILAQSLLS